MPIDKERVMRRLAALLLGTGITSSYMVETVYAQATCDDPAALSAIAGGTTQALLDYLASTPTGSCSFLVNAALAQAEAGNAVELPLDLQPGPH